jgi:hypothetical protein
LHSVSDKDEDTFNSSIINTRRDDVIMILRCNFVY